MVKRSEKDQVEDSWEELKRSRLAQQIGRFVRGPLREWALVVLRWCRDHPLGAVTIAFAIVLLNLFSSGGTALLQVAAPLLGLPLLAFGGYALWRRAIALEDQTAATREGLADDRFVKAVAQLGDDKLFMRIGGIHALGKLVHNYPAAYHEAVLAVLGAFVRTYNWDAVKQEAAETPADIQAASTVILRLTSAWDRAHRDEDDSDSLLDAELEQELPSEPTESAELDG